MRQYECVYILDPTLTDEQQEPLIERFKTLVSDNGGTVTAVDKWERRRLAYEVKGKREGVYVVMNFNGEAATEAELGRVLGITDGILRHLVIRTDQKPAGSRKAA
jgi:small subunit ribosomal protein S6